MMLYSMSWEIMVIYRPNVPNFTITILASRGISIAAVANRISR